MNHSLASGIFNDSYPPITDGVAMVAKNYAYWLNKILGPSCVITSDVPDHFDLEAFPVYRIFSMPLGVRPPYRVGLDLTGETRERRLRGGYLKETLQTNIFNIDFDIVHSHCPFSTGILAHRLAHKKNIPLVTTFHTKYREDFLRATKSPLLTDIAINQIIEYYKKADFVWVPSEETIEILRSYGYKGKIEIVQNGTDIIVEDSQFPALREAGASYFQIADEIPTLLYIGQHIKEKNLDILVDSLGILKKHEIVFEMLFIGGGYYEEALKEKAKTLGIENNVKFMGVIRDRELIKQAYARADLLFFPSLYDTSSLIIREAAGMHLPALLVKNSSTSAGVIDGENGFLSNNDAQAMFQKIAAIINDKALLKKAGNGAYTTLFKSWANVLEDVAEKYRKIVRDWKGR